MSFDIAPDKIEIYPFNGCKSNPPSGTATAIDTLGNGASGITFNPAPTTPSVTLSFNQAARSNAAIYTSQLSGGVRSDTLQFCVYAATTAGASNKQIGFTEVKVLLTFTANGNIVNVKIVDADTQEGTTVSAIDAFQGLVAKTCDGATALSQVRSNERCQNL